MNELVRVLSSDEQSTLWSLEHLHGREHKWCGGERREMVRDSAGPHFLPR